MLPAEFSSRVVDMSRHPRDGGKSFVWVNCCADISIRLLRAQKCTLFSIWKICFLSMCVIVFARYCGDCGMGRALITAGAEGDGGESTCCIYP